MKELLRHASTLIIHTCDTTTGLPAGCSTSSSSKAAVESKPEAVLIPLREAACPYMYLDERKDPFNTSDIQEFQRLRHRTSMSQEWATEKGSSWHVGLGG